MDEKQILATYGRQGWQIVGRRNVPKTVSGRDENNQPTQTQVPSDQWVWTLAGPNGEPDQITVRTVESGPNKGGVGYEVVEPPKAAPRTTTDRPPEPNVSTSAAQIPVWNDKTKQYDWVPNPNYTPGSTARPPEPAVNTSAPQIPKWDTTTQQWGWATNPNYKPDAGTRPPAPSVSTEAPQIPVWDATTSSWGWQPNPNYKPPKDAREVAVVDNKLVDKNTGEVIYTAPEGVKFQTAQDGSILAIDPSNPSNVQVIWQPDKPKSLLPGQSPNQPNFIQTDPKTGELTTTPNPIYGQGTPQTSEVSGQQGPKILQKVIAPDGSVTYQSVDNPAYTPAGQTALQEYLDGVKQVEGMIASGQMTVLDASRYKDLLKQQYESKLQGTTPYQMEQDRQAAQVQRMQSGQSLLNQRVSSGSNLASSLLNSAVGIASNKNFMDPSAVAGLNIFGGAASVPDFINRLGGGQGVMDAAGGAVQAGLTGQAPPQSVQALLAAALGGPSGPGGAQPMPYSGGPPPPREPMPYSGGGPPPMEAMNIGSGATSNPQPPMPGLVSPLGRQPESAAASTARNQAAMDPNDPSAFFLRQALGGAM